jgi:casein kinase 1 gamma
MQKLEKVVLVRFTWEQIETTMRLLQSNWKHYQIKKSKPRLSQEYEYYQQQGSNEAIPALFMYEKFNEKNALVMELLGPNLFDLYKKCGRKFSLSTVKEIAIQVIDRLEYIHSKYLIHCDIKPENILMGCTSSIKENILHLVDFGLSKKYVTSESGKHIPFKKKKGAGSGTMRYMSINTHLGHIQSRRDDLESLGYVLVYFMKGRLPWQGLNCKTSREHKQKVCDIKTSTSIEKLCEACPKEFQSIMHNYFNHVKNLDFDEKPDYFLVKNLFAHCVDENFKFDWQQSKQR